MKNMVIAFIAAFALIAAGLIIMLVFAILRGGSGFSLHSSEMKLVNTQNIKLDSIDTVTISFHSANVTFYASDNDELIFKEYMNYTPEDDELALVEVNSNELAIRNGMEHTFVSIWQFNRNHRVEIYLPAGYSGKLTVGTSSGNINSELVLRLKEFHSESTSGNIRINEVYADNISAKTSSGNINFKIAEGNRSFTATSGNIRVSGGAGESIFDTSSGNITVEKANGLLTAQASSGEIRFSDCLGGGSFNASSGNITLAFTSITESLSASVSSGNINLSIPDDTSFQFTADTSSGSIRTFFDDLLDYNKRGNSAHGTIGENPGIDIDLAATSGNIRVSD